MGAGCWTSFHPTRERDPSAQPGERSAWVRRGLAVLVVVALGGLTVANVLGDGDEPERPPLRPTPSQQPSTESTPTSQPLSALRWTDPRRPGRRLGLHQCSSGRCAGEGPSSREGPVRRHAPRPEPVRVRGEPATTTPAVPGSAAPACRRCMCPQVPRLRPAPDLRRRCHQSGWRSWAGRAGPEAARSTPCCSAVPRRSRRTCPARSTTRRTAPPTAAGSRSAAGTGRRSSSSATTPTLSWSRARRTARTAYPLLMSVDGDPTDETRDKVVAASLRIDGLGRLLPRPRPGRCCGVPLSTGAGWCSTRGAPTSGSCGAGA